MPRWLEENRSALAKIRSRSGLSIERAAVSMNITSRTLSRYENGNNDVPMLIADKMSRLYGVGIEEIRNAVINMKDGKQKNGKMD